MKGHIIVPGAGGWINLIALFFTRKVLVSSNIKWQKQPPEVFCEEGALKNFAKFTEKHLCQRPVFNKVVGLRHFGAFVFQTFLIALERSDQVVFSF